MIKMKTVNCRICGGETWKTFVDLGYTPLSNSYLNKNMMKVTEEQIVEFQKL